MRLAPWARLLLGVVLLTPPASAQAAPDAKIRGAGSLSHDAFGISVSLSGARALIGAPAAGNYAGSAMVDERQGDGSWLEVAHLTASDGAELDEFGGDVSLSGDRALIGALNDDDDGSSSGSAYVFERQGDGSWLEVAKLTAGDAAADDIFGCAVSLDGERALIGAGGDDGAYSNSGSAYVFERQGDGSWLQVAKLAAGAAGPMDTFGDSVSLSGDRALVGAQLDSAGTILISGAAHVFERHENGSWTEVAQLAASELHFFDHFGASVSLSGDVAVAGAPGDDQGAFNSGCAYVFERQGNGSWIDVAKLKAPDAAAGGLLGSAVSVLGGRALLGKPWGGDDGSAWLFERQSDGSWQPEVQLAGDDLAGATTFGYSLSLSEEEALVGAPYPSVSGLPTPAFVFELGSLYHGAPAVSVAGGGSQALLLRAGSEHAGETFVLVGSYSGTSPGLSDPASGLVLPLNRDAYFLWLLKQGGGGIVSPLAGVLDGGGAAGATFALPPGSATSFVGLTLHHAYVALDFPGSGAATLASNAVKLELVP